MFAFWPAKNRAAHPLVHKVKVIRISCLSAPVQNTLLPYWFPRTCPNHRINFNVMGQGPWFPFSLARSLVQAQ